MLSRCGLEDLSHLEREVLRVYVVILGARTINRIEKIKDPEVLVSKK